MAKQKKSIIGKARAKVMLVLIKIKIGKILKKIEYLNSLKCPAWECIVYCDMFCRERDRLYNLEQDLIDRLNS